jgi:hypothetical protein
MKIRERKRLCRELESMKDVCEVQIALSKMTSEQLCMLVEYANRNLKDSILRELRNVE